MESGSVRSSHQTVSDYCTLRQWFPNIQQSRFLTGCRRLENSSFTFHFDTSLSSLMVRNLQCYPTTVLNERVSYFYGKYTMTPHTDFQGVKTLTPQVLRTCFKIRCIFVELRRCSSAYSSHDGAACGGSHLPRQVLLEVCDATSVTVGIDNRVTASF